MPNVVRFDAYEVDLPAGQLYKHGIKIGLRDQSFQVLAALLEHPGEVVTREDLRKRLWSDEVFVDFDNNLNAAVGRLREALGDSADHPHFIETLPKRGYRFLENVSKPPDTKTALKPATRNAHSSAGVDAEAPQSAVELGTTNHAPVQEPLSHSRFIPNFITGRKKGAIATVAIVAALGLTLFLWSFWRRPSNPPAELTQRRLTFNSSEDPVQHNAISPDGKYLAYSDASGIHVKLLSTGEEHFIPKPGRVPADAVWSVDSWFPDGTQLLADISETGGHGSLWTVSALGQSARELREDARGYEVSPDGTHIAFAAPPTSGSSGNAREVWVMDSQGENAQKVVAPVGENEGLGYVHWSPDGQRLAYSIALPTPGGSYLLTTIESCDLKGTNRKLIVSEPDFGVGDFRWLPGGRIVYDRGDLSGDNLWQITIDAATGTPMGKPRRITQWAERSIESLSASADGKRLALLQSTNLQQIYLAELGTGGTRLLSAPRRLTNQETYDRASAWTADSKAILFDSALNGQVEVFKQGINDGAAQLLVAAPQGPANTMWPMWPRLSGDGDWIIYAEVPQTTPAPLRVMRIPVSGGVPQFMGESAKGLDDHCSRAPANLCVALDESQDGKQVMVKAFDPLTGMGKVLRTIEKDPSAHFFGSDLSPDGSTLAIARSGEAQIHIRVLSLIGGPDREITVKGWSNLPWMGLYWSADGKGFYAASLSPEPSALLYVDLNGNARVLWRNRAGIVCWGLPSPDGRYLAIEVGFSNRNVWMLEGF
jgi:Tol biopolymer transport system component/DNA-binding winged helix-turn-helix (wHTH) protein